MRAGKANERVEVCRLGVSEHKAHGTIPRGTPSFAPDSLKQAEKVYRCQDTPPVYRPKCKHRISGGRCADKNWCHFKERVCLAGPDSLKDGEG